ncbi:carbohydrate ABC transporter permease [Cellulosilyticum sp. I15G10I2]|uniref:carbohydrate ABC transporter permease n=1 Tax=Cellulosilyticum sp. I15G10I2 TaxID=1892843 RepID=UPI00085C1357
MKKDKQLQTIGIYIVLALLSVLIILPFLWMVSSSLKVSHDVFSLPMEWIPKEAKWENYLTIWTKIPLITFFKNTVKLTFIITILQLLTSSFAAYAFAKMNFTGRDALFLAYVGTIAVPWQVYMVPQFIMMRRFNLADTHTAIILLQAFTAFGVFLMRQFYLSIPNELSESARIDGLNEYGIYWRIILPLSKPAIATLTIFSFVTVWNDYMGPMIYLNSTEMKTIQLGLRMFITQYSADYNLIMAAALVSLVPVFILFLFMQRFFIEGIATSGLKG